MYTPDLAQYASDAVASLEPPITPEILADMFLDQYDWPKGRDDLVKQFEYYL